MSMVCQKEARDVYLRVLNIIEVHRNKWNAQVRRERTMGNEVDSPRYREVGANHICTGWPQPRECASLQRGMMPWRSVKGPRLRTPQETFHRALSYRHVP